MRAQLKIIFLGIVLGRQLFIQIFLRNTRFLSPLHTLVTLLSNRQLDTIALRQADVGLVALANDKDVTHTSGEGVALSILDVNDVE